MFSPERFRACRQPGANAVGDESLDLLEGTRDALVRDVLVRDVRVREAHAWGPGPRHGDAVLAVLRTPAPAAT